MAFNYTGPAESNDFDAMDPDTAAARMAEDMFGFGWLLDDPLELVATRGGRLAMAERELRAAVMLARLRGCNDMEIAAAAGLSSESMASLNGG